MPVAAFPGPRNWGYDGVNLYAPHDAYGGPEALRRLVDACHAHGLGLILDVVYNHFGPEGNYLGRLRPYLTDRYRTPWGDAINYDGPDSDEVRAPRDRKRVATGWREYHVDGLRLDAIQGIHDTGARPLLAELADAFHADAARAGRQAWLVAESGARRVRRRHGDAVRDADRRAAAAAWQTWPGLWIRAVVDVLQHGMAERFGAGGSPHPRRTGAGMQAFLQDPGTPCA